MQKSLAACLLEEADAIPLESIAQPDRDEDNWTVRIDIVPEHLRSMWILLEKKKKEYSILCKQNNLKHLQRIQLSNATHTLSQMFWGSMRENPLFLNLQEQKDGLTVVKGWWAVRTVANGPGLG